MLLFYINVSFAALNALQLDKYYNCLHSYSLLFLHNPLSNHESNKATGLFVLLQIRLII
jgi:hypothetical protein